MTITKEMLIGEAVMQHPLVADVLTRYGLHCVGCHVNKFESIEAGAKGHGMPDEIIDKMVGEVNAAISDGGKEFSITDAAAEKISDFVKKEKATYFRIKIKPGGCSGFMYEFTLEKQKSADDNEFEHNGAYVLIDKKSLAMLKGSRIDYFESLKESGFKVENPNATASCGCGSSFT